MNLFERLDAVADRWNVLRHPFYERWECGALRRQELAYYAGEYRHAVTALAALAASASDAGHAAEEAAHVAIWDDFAAELDAELDRAPRAETAACAEAWSGTGVEGDGPRASQSSTRTPRRSQGRGRRRGCRRPRR